MYRREFLSIAGGMGLALGLPQVIQAADAPTLLTVSDAATNTTKSYSDADLMALPQTSFKTTTIWTEGAKTFSGPSLKSVLDDAGLPAQNLKLHAVNDYNVVFPISNMHDHAPIIANRIDGNPFPLRRKGPLWVIFPFDQTPAFQTEEIFSLCVWQLDKITMVEA